MKSWMFDNGILFIEILEAETHYISTAQEWDYGLFSEVLRHEGAYEFIITIRVINRSRIWISNRDWDQRRYGLTESLNKFHIYIANVLDYDRNTLGYNTPGPLGKWSILRLIEEPPHCRKQFHTDQPAISNKNGDKPPYPVLRERLMKPVFHESELKYYLC